MVWKQSTESYRATIHAAATAGAGTVRREAGWRRFECETGYPGDRGPSLPGRSARHADEAGAAVVATSGVADRDDSGNVLLMTIPAFTIRLCFVLAYLLLALPLPVVLLDHELGLLSGDPAHTVLDDHAWLDHAAGAGLASGDVGILSSELVVLCEPRPESCVAHAPVASPSVRAPPLTLYSSIKHTAARAHRTVAAVPHLF